MTEASLQCLIVDWFRWQLRWVVLETGQYKESQRAVNTNGTPDLLIRNPRWPVGALLALELKTPQGRLSEAQRRLFAEGGMIVCRSLEDAQEAARRADAIFGEEVAG